MEKKRLILSSQGLNRHKFRLMSEGMLTENYKKNPVLLFGHSKSLLPIGRLEDIRVEDDAQRTITAIPVFDEKDSFALAVKDKWENGFLSAASVWFEPIRTTSDPAMMLPGQQYETVLEWDLLETSIVIVPGNADASKGLMLDAFCSDPERIPEIKTQPAMDLKKIAQTLGLAADADEAAVVAAINKLQTENQTLGASRVENLLAVGVANGHVTEANMETFKKLAAADFDEVAKLLSVKPAATPVKADAPKPNGTSLLGMLSGGAPKANGAVEDRANWTFDDWGKKDQQGLLSMKRTEQERYAALAAARYAAIGVN